MFLLQLHADQSGEWYEIDPTGNVVTHTSVPSLSDCPKISQNAPLVILLPGEQVTVTTVKLPKIRASERLRAIPFALEEQLACDPEQIYVALGEQVSSNIFSVAVLDKQYFNQQNDAWHAANLHPRVVTPDFLSLALEPETWSIFYCNKMVWVRTGLQSGFSVDEHNALAFLQLLLEKDKKNIPKRVICWENDHVVNLTPLEKYGITIELREGIQKPIFDVKLLTTKIGLNLLQGKYRPSAQHSSLYKNWLLCAVVAASFVGVSLACDVAQWLYLRHQYGKIQTQVLQVYQQIFPGETDVLEPRFRVDALLKQFEAAARGSEFAQLLWVSGKTLPHFPKVQVDAIQFSENTLSVTARADDMSSLNEWLATVHQPSVTVNQKINTEKTGVSAVIQLSEKEK